jgi:hypothetical protein
MTDCSTILLNVLNVSVKLEKETVMSALCKWHHVMYQMCATKEVVRSSLSKNKKRACLVVAKIELGFWWNVDEQLESTSVRVWET